MVQILDEYLYQLQEIEPVTMMAIAASAGVVTAANLTYRTYQQFLSKHARRCNDLPDQEKAVCTLMLKLNAKQNQLRLLRQLNSKCSADKNPEKCRESLRKKINKAQEHIKLFSDRLDELRRK